MGNYWTDIDFGKSSQSPLMVGPGVISCWVLSDLIQDS